MSRNSIKLKFHHVISWTADLVSVGYCWGNWEACISPWWVDSRWDASLPTVSSSVLRRQFLHASQTSPGRGHQWSGRSPNGEAVARTACHRGRYAGLSIASRSAPRRRQFISWTRTPVVWKVAVCTVEWWGSCEGCMLPWWVDSW